MPSPVLPARALPGHGPHVLFVHGMFLSPVTWAQNTGPFDAVCRPVVVTLWGHAGAPVPDDPGVLHPDGYAAQFEDLRERVGAERWVVVGQSLGAALVLHYALRHPDRVAGVVVTNSLSSVADAGWSAEAKHAARVARYRDQGHAAFDDEPLHPVRWPGLTEEQRRPHLDAWAAHRPEGMMATFGHTVAPLSLQERLPGLAMPALVVQGTREDAFDGAAAILSAALPEVEVVRLDGGHMVNQDRPDEFNAAVTAFLRRVAP